MPATCIGDESCTSIVLVRPFVQVPVAPVMVTAGVPVIIKSDPLVAIELHWTGSLKLTLIEAGEQAGTGMLVIVAGNDGGTTKFVLAPAVTVRMQGPISVLPSVPVAICNW